MSSATVRAQMLAFLSAQPIAYINRWYAAEPWYVAAERLNLAANNGAGAVAWLHITDESENRATLGAPSGGVAAGQKEITYKLAVVMLGVWAIPADAASEDVYIGPIDAMIEGVKARLRSDPKAGTGPGLDGVIFQQSQDDGDLTVARNVPLLDPGGGQLLIWQRVDTTVREIITA